jgi:hypothetical protein
MTGTIHRLLAPHDPAVLDKALLDRQRVHLSTGQGDAFSRLLPWSTLNGLITPERLDSGQIKAVRRGMELPRDMILTRSGKGYQLRGPEFQSLLQQGLSLLISSVHELVPEIAALNAMLERRYRAVVSTNAYVSFSKDSAFTAHWDDHSVLVLQLHGKKSWWCYGSPEDDPHERRSFASTAELGPAEWTASLVPGDVLYVPRGDIHRAEVQGGHSVHLTIAIRPPMAADAAAWLIKRCLADAEARHDILAHAGADALERQAERIRALLHRQVDALDLTCFLAMTDAGRSPCDVLDLGSGRENDPATRVQPALLRRIALPVSGGGEVRLGGGRSARIDAAEASVLALLLERDELTVGALAEMFPAQPLPAVSAAVGRLARKGLVFMF